MGLERRVAARFVLAKSLREDLSDLEHDRWSRWMKHQFSKGTFNDDGTWTMAKSDVERWKRQMGTPYDELSKSEKDSDRRETDNTLEVLKEHDVV